MAKHSVLRLDDKLKETFSVRVPAGQHFENGFVAKLGAVEPANLDVRGALTATSGDSVVIIGNPAIVKDNNKIGTGMESEYRMEAGEVVRGYRPELNKLVSVSLEGFINEPAVGDIVAPNGFKLDVVADAPATGTHFKVVAIEKVGGALAVNVTHTGTIYAVLETTGV